jgi:cyanophycinase-like exopeptidase
MVDSIQMKQRMPTPGPVVLFGSGETSPSGRKIFDTVLRQIPPSPGITLLETPAGFELNSPQVIGRVADFVSHRLQNYDPRVTVIPARSRGTPFSPDNPEIVAPLLQADMIFMGPGSPTYAVRQLRDSLAWHMLVARHRLGAAVALASAATIAISAYALPVYEIYKVGDDLHWKEGLDLFGIYGLSLVFIPHWNNNDGGDELDTSRCFMGQARFAPLMDMLPPDLTVLGIDEQTALIMEPEKGTCKVVGLGGVTLIHTGEEHGDASSPDKLDGTGLEGVARLRKGHVHQFQNGETFPLTRIGSFRRPETGVGLPPEVWEQAVAAWRGPAVDERNHPPEVVMALVDEREAARQEKKWTLADQLRQKIGEMGWQVMDTPDGPQLEPKD